MSTKSTPIDLSQRVVMNVRRLRKMRGWSARELEERTAATGCKITRQVTANRENRLVTSRVSVDELFVLAAVFGRTVTDLVAEEIACEQCAGQPPSGFSCNICGAAA